MYCLNLVRDNTRLNYFNYVKRNILINTNAPYFHTFIYIYYGINLGINPKTPKTSIFTIL